MFYFFVAVARHLQFYNCVTISNATKLAFGRFLTNNLAHNDLWKKQMSHLTELSEEEIYLEKIQVLVICLHLHY